MSLSDEDKRRIQEEGRLRARVRRSERGKQTAIGCGGLIVVVVIIIIIATIASSISGGAESNYENVSAAAEKAPIAYEVLREWDISNTGKGAEITAGGRPTEDVRALLEYFRDDAFPAGSLNIIVYANVEGYQASKNMQAMCDQDPDPTLPPSCAQADALRQENWVGVLHRNVNNDYEEIELY